MGYPEISVFSWQPRGGGRNFGDHLAKVVVAAAAAEKALTLDDEVSVARRLFSIGSVLHFAADGDVVWGSGVNGKIPIENIRARKLDVRAVRGPLTKAVLEGIGIEVPPVFGDPALLVKRFFSKRFRRDVTRRYVVIPNLHDEKLVRDWDNVVSPLWGWNRIVREILAAELVVSSSLHGIIIAEAFGVPARFLRLSDRENLFKYNDYAQGTGRDGLAPATSLSEALAMGGHPPIIFDEDRLLRSFPSDLWDCPGG